MSLQRNLFVLQMVFLLIIEYVCDNNTKEIKVNGYWKKIFEEENKSPSPISSTITWTSGWRTLASNEQTVVAKHTVGGGISSGDSMKLLSISIDYSYEHSKTSTSLKETESYQSREQTDTFTVLPWTTFVRWQLVVNISGVEYYDQRFTDTNSTEVPTTVPVIVTVQLRQQIQFGSTRIRIKHKSEGRYIIVVGRMTWQAATLGSSNLFHFILYDSGQRGFRIKALNAMSPGYEWLHSSFIGGIDFDKDKDHGSSSMFEPTQFWYLNKSPPLYDGDVVTFRNNYYSSSYMCHYRMENNWLKCRKNKEDEWILEVV